MEEEGFLNHFEESTTFWVRFKLVLFLAHRKIQRVSLGLSFVQNL